MLPFTPEVFFANFAQYNAAIWPAQIVAYALGFSVILLLLRPAAWSSPLIALILAAAWIWNGAVYHMDHFARINFAAPLFGILFIAEGLLLAWSGAVARRLTFRFRADPMGWTGLTLLIFAMAVYPVLGWLASHGWPRGPAFGVAPCPTVIFTMGLLSLAEGRVPLHLLVIPVLWALLGGSAAWLLNVPEDLALPLAAFVGLWLILRKTRVAA
jgi:hypothetical protein